MPPAPRHRLTAGACRLLLAMVAFGLILAATWLAARHADRQQRAILLQQARLVAQSLNIDSVKTLTGTEVDRTSADYQRIKAQLVSIVPANPNCKWFYLMGRRTDPASTRLSQRAQAPGTHADDTIFFFVDSAPPDALDMSLPGQTYDEVPSNFRPVFNTKDATVIGPVTTKWGSWVSALVPLINPQTGQVLAVLGMDVDANTWRWDVAARVMLPVGLMLVLLIVVIAVLYATHPLPSGRVDASPKPILWRLLPPMTGIISLLMVAAGTLLWQQQRLLLARETAADNSNIAGGLAVALKQGATTLNATAQPIAEDAAVRKALRGNDTAELLATWQPVFDRLQRARQLSHFYFYDRARRCVLRVHRPGEQGGDLNNHSTVLKAERTGRAASGIELDALGTLTLRVVQPVFDGTQLVGYVELGKEIESELQMLHIRSGTHLTVLLRKGVLNQENWEKGMRLMGRKAEWDLLPHSVVIYASQGRLADAFMPLADEVAQGNYAKEEIQREVTTDGNDWRVSASPIRDATGAAVGDLLILRDITVAKAAFARLMALCETAGAVLLALLLSSIFVILRRADARILAQQAALHESEKKHRLLFESAGDAILIHDAHGRMLEVNPTACERLGFTYAELLAMTVAQVEAPAPAAHAAERSAKLMVNDRLTYETEHRCKDHSLIPVEVNARLITWDGQPVTMSVCRDLTKRKWAEAAWLEAEWKFRALFEKGPIGVAYHEMIYDAADHPVNFLFLDANASYQEITGVNPCGKTATEAFPGIATGAFDWIGTLGEVARSGKSIRLEQQLQPNDRWYDCVAYQYKPDHFVTTFLNITERKQAEAQVLTLLEESNQARMALLSIIEDTTRTEADLKRLATAIEQAAEIIVITNTSGVIQYVNPAFETITGYTREEAIGQNPRILKSGQQEAEVYRLLWATLASGNIWQGRLINRKKDGTFYTQETTISPVRNTASEIFSYVAVMRDITAQKLAEDELQTINRNLEAATTRANEMATQAAMATLAKSEFLANMSHEIRTPLNGVIGMNGLLLDTDLDDEQLAYAEVVRTSGESLLGLLNDILDFSKIEAKKLDLETLDFDLSDLLEDFTATLALLAHEKNLELLCRVDSAVPERLRGDPGRLRQILTNLTGNAIKFTSSGEVEVRVDLLADTPDEVRLRFTVRDTGVGISSDKVAQLFSKFTQLDTSTTRQYGGTGLGLAISKELAELMGGEIGVTSQVGKGSEFWFTARLGRQEEAKPTADQPPAYLRGVRVLIVDDNATHREILATSLTFWGMRPVEAADSNAALQALNQGLDEADAFQMVLIDMQMPGIDGATLGRTIKADSRLAPIHMVIFTSLGAWDDTQDFEDIGFAAYVTKPVWPQALKAVLSRVLAEPDGMELQRQPITTHNSTREALNQFSGHRVRILLAEDNITNQQVAQSILKKLGLRADAVANGAEAVKALETIPYDLVLMDVQMPVMDGYDATLLIRSPQSSVRNHQVPIIAMTAHALRGDREKCLQAGMDDYVPKPVSPQSLAAILRKWLPADMTQGPPEDEDSNTPFQPALGIFDQAGMTARLMHDAALIQMVSQGFLLDIPQQIIAIANHLEAGNALAVERQAHTLKGAAANVGGERLRELAAKIERAAAANDLSAAASLIPDLEIQFAALQQAMTQAP
ncbi:MAG: PAS domain S-box protein [Verrucomicrobiota bacterium]